MQWKKGKDFYNWYTGSEASSGGLLRLQSHATNLCTVWRVKDEAALESYWWHFLWATYAQMIFR